MFELWVEMGRRTQKISFICHLDERIGLRRQRRDVLWDVEGGTVAA